MPFDAAYFAYLQSLDAAAAAGPSIIVPSGRILGNVSGATGPAVPITAAQLAAMLPDQPSRGTWTPTLSCATPGDLSVVYGGVTAAYRLAAGGAMVDIDFSMSVTPTFTTASGVLYVLGLPFPVHGRASGGVFGVAQSTGFAWGTSITMMSWQAVAGMSRLQLLGGRTAAGQSNVPITSLVSGTNYVLRGQGSYPIL